MKPSAVHVRVSRLVFQGNGPQAPDAAEIERAIAEGVGDAAAADPRGGDVAGAIARAVAEAVRPRIDAAAAPFPEPPATGAGGR